MSVTPNPRAVTSPDADTVATAVLLDSQLAWPVTFCVPPPDKTTVAVNWLVCVTATKDWLPDIDSVVTLAGAVGLERDVSLLQPPSTTVPATASPKIALAKSRMDCSLDNRLRVAANRAV